MSPCAIAVKSNTFQEWAVSHSCSSKHYIIAICQVIDCELFVRLFDSHFPGPLFFLSILEHQPALKLAAKAFYRAGCNHALRGPSTAKKHINARVRAACCDCPCNITISYKPYSCTNAPYLLNQPLMAFAVQYDDGYIFHIFANFFRNGLDILFYRCIKVYRTLCFRSNCYFVHIGIRGMKKGAFWG